MAQREEQIHALSTHSHTPSISHSPTGPSRKLTWVQESQEEAEDNGRFHAGGGKERQLPSLAEHRTVCH